MLSKIKQMKKDREEAKVFLDSLRPDEKVFSITGQPVIFKSIPDDIDDEGFFVHYKDGRCINTLWLLKHKWIDKYGSQIDYYCERCGKIRV